MMMSEPTYIPQFADEEHIDWYRSPIPKERLQELTTRSDARGFLHTFAQLALLSATGFTAWYSLSHWPWYATVAAIYFHGTVFNFVGLIGPAHELGHRTVFKTPFWNEFFLKLYAFLSWTNYPIFRRSHVKHHALTVYAELDLEVVLPQKLRWFDVLTSLTVNPQAAWAMFHNAVRMSRGTIKGEWEARLYPPEDKKGRREFRNWARVILVGHILLAALFIWSGQWILLLLITFGQCYAGWLGLLVGFPQHAGLISSVPDFRLSGRTFMLNPFARFLYWNMNYHVEHHMYAAVPFYNLPKLRTEIEADLPPAHPGLWSTWKELITILKRQKENPEYVFVPELPVKY